MPVDFSIRRERQAPSRREAAYGIAPSPVEVVVSVVLVVVGVVVLVVGGAVVVLGAGVVGVAAGAEPELAGVPAAWVPRSALPPPPESAASADYCGDQPDDHDAKEREQPVDRAWRWLRSRGRRASAGLVAMAGCGHPSHLSASLPMWGFSLYESNLALNRLRFVRLHLPYRLGPWLACGLLPQPSGFEGFLLLAKGFQAGHLPCPLAW